MTCRLVCNKSSTTDATSGSETQFSVHIYIALKQTTVRYVAQLEHIILISSQLDSALLYSLMLHA